MARQRGSGEAAAPIVTEERAIELASSEPVAGIPGPGRWLVAEFVPCSLFSLKMSAATSSVGKTLLIPTPYAIKMAIVDAGFRAGLGYEQCAELLRLLVHTPVRIAPPERAVVTHTFVKIRQEPKDKTKDPLQPYISSIAYREVVYHQGLWRWAFDLAAGPSTLAERLVAVLPHVNYVGKRGSFIQYRGMSRAPELDSAFTQEATGAELAVPRRCHVVALDEFGPEADLQVLSSYTEGAPKRDKHRRFVDTLVPIGVVNTGPGFTEYQA